MKIVFRSRYSVTRTNRFSHQKILSSSSEWMSLRPYEFGDDARHIVWKKSNFPYEVRQKNYEDCGGISLLFIRVESFGDNFSDIYASRSEWQQQSLQILIKNAKSAKIPYRSFSFQNWDEWKKFCQKNTFSRCLVIFFGGIQDEKSLGECGDFFAQNELIWVLGHHPFEKNPHSNELFSNKVFLHSQKKYYLTMLEKEEKIFQKNLTTHKIPLIITDTSVSIDITLHYFFKYQYEYRI